MNMMRIVLALTWYLACVWFFGWLAEYLLPFQRLTSVWWGLPYFLSAATISVLVSFVIAGLDLD